MTNYYEEIENYIKRNEINKKRRYLQENYDILSNYWEIGRLLVEAQGGEKHATYGNKLIKEWSMKFTKNYGKGYDASNLRRFRQFYMHFPKCGTMCHISWSNIRILLPIKDDNERNYYFNLCIEKNLSARKLQDEIKSGSYTRLIDKREYVEIVLSRKEYSILDDMKSPVIIKVDKNKEIKSEKDLELIILSEIEYVLSQLGKGFCFIGSQYKIDKYYIDLLLFNIELNSYVVVELKIRKLKIEDKAQVENYMALIDKNVKKAYHNKTIGIIVSKEQDNYVANFIRRNDLIPLTYKIKNK